MARLRVGESTPVGNLRRCLGMDDNLSCRWCNRRAPATHQPPSSSTIPPGSNPCSFFSESRSTYDPVQCPHVTCQTRAPIATLAHLQRHWGPLHPYDPFPTLTCPLCHATGLSHAAMRRHRKTCGIPIPPPAPTNAALFNLPDYQRRRSRRCPRSQAHGENSWKEPYSL